MYRNECYYFSYYLTAFHIYHFGVKFIVGKIESFIKCILTNNDKKYYALYYRISKETSMAYCSRHSADNLSKVHLLYM